MAGQELKKIAEIAAAIDQLNGTLDVTNAKLLSISKAAQSAFSGGSSASSPKDVANNMKQLSSESARVTAVMTEQMKIERSLYQQKARLKAAESDYAKELAKVRVETAKVNAESKLQAKLSSSLTGVYEKLNAKLTVAANKYRDLAVRRELGVRLSAKEEATMERLAAKISQYDGVLKKVDAQMGRHQRNVGNYRSGFDGLGFSVAQLSREMPAFANSMQTGFMAISNNIPMLVDEIKRLNVANKELQSQGKPTQSVLKSIGAAIFSWQTAISIGVTVLTVYGAELFDLAFGLSAAEKAQKKFNEELAKADAEAKTAAQGMEVLRDIVLDTTQSEQTRKNALLELNKVIPATTKFTLAQLDANKGLNDEYNEFINTTEKYVLAATTRAKADILARKVAEEEIKLGEEQSKSIRERTKWYEKLVFSSRGVPTTIATINRLNKEDQAQQVNIDKLNALLKEYTIQAINAERELNKLNDTTEEAVSRRDKVEGYYQAFVDGEKQREEAIKRAGETFQKVIEGFGFEDGNLFDGAMDGFEEFARNIVETNKKTNDKLKEDDKEWADYKKQLYADLGNAVLDFADVWLEGQISRIDAELDYWDGYYENLLNQQGLTAEQRNLIENERYQKEQELEKKRRDAAKKQALLNRAEAIFGITINTAQAVMKTLGQTGFFGLPLAAIVAALGAIQIATVLATPLPQYAKGTDNHAGGFAILGDGGRKEVITDQNMNPLGISPATDTLYNLPKGSRVYSSIPEFQRELERIAFESSIMAKGANAQQVVDSKLADLDKKIERGIRKGFRNVNIHNHMSIDHALWKSKKGYG